MYSHFKCSHLINFKSGEIFLKFFHPDSVFLLLQCLITYRVPFICLYTLLSAIWHKYRVRIFFNQSYALERFMKFHNIILNSKWHKEMTFCSSAHKRNPRLKNKILKTAFLKFFSVYINLTIIFIHLDTSYTDTS